MGWADDKTDAVSYTLDGCMFLFPLLVIPCPLLFQLSTPNHELFREGEGCVGVWGATFLQLI